MTETVFLKDSEWSVIDGRACRVLDFTPLMAEVTNGKVLALNRTMPYAAVDFECAQLDEAAKGFITHRLDFLHLWSAFNERGVGEDEEVIITWTRQYTSWWARRTARAMPSLIVWICLKGAYELMTDPNFKPELTGEARFRAQAPVERWVPQVLA